MNIELNSVFRLVAGHTAISFGLELWRDSHVYFCFGYGLLSQYSVSCLRYCWYCVYLALFLLSFDRSGNKMNSSIQACSFQNYFHVRFKLPLLHGERGKSAKRKNEHKKGTLKIKVEIYFTYGMLRIPFYFIVILWPPEEDHG